MESHYYEVKIEWQQERKGLMTAAGIQNQIEVATPPQFPKGMVGVWSPEHLFTAAISSCFMTTFLAIAENSGLEFSSFSCNARGKLEHKDGSLLISEVVLEPHVVVAFDKDKAKTQRILEKSEAACLISNSVKSKVSVQNTLIEAGQSIKAA